MEHILVLLSGGLDSSTCLAQALQKTPADMVHTLNITYGQKHAKELQAAQAIASYYKVSYKLLDLSAVFADCTCSLLVQSQQEISHKSYDEQLIEQHQKGISTVSTYVPFRNGLMLSAAASYGQSINAKKIIYGAHADDAAGRAYPDCTPEFVKYMNKAIYEGSGHDITIEAPFINFTKAQIVKLGLELKVPYELTWSCYEGGDKPCCSCGTCRDRIRAFELNDTTDPLLR